MAESTEKFIVLDLLRFAAALCVLAFHFEIFAIKGASTVPRYFAGFDAAVDFFFILSGFVITHSSRSRINDINSYRLFIWRRVARIYPLHILTLIFVVIMAATASRLGVQLGEPQRFASEYLPANLLMTQAWGFHDRLTFNIVSWSISAEWFLYLTFPVSLFVVRRATPFTMLVVLALVFLSLRVLETHFGLTPWNDRTYAFAIIRALPTFMLGIALWHIWDRYRTRIQVRLGTVGGLFVAAIVSMYLRAPAEILVALFGAIVLAGAFVKTSSFGASIGQFCETIGNSSYGLYMLHHIIGVIVFSVLAPRLGLGTATAVTMALIASILASIASFRLFEDPVRKFLIRRFGR